MNAEAAWSSGAIASAKAVLALAGAALLLLGWRLDRAGVPGAGRRARDAALIATAALALLAWTRFDPRALWSDLHIWEFYHHFLGAKYFPELEYTRLYQCTLVADVESGSPAAPERPVRDLSTNQIGRVGEALADPEFCKAHFTPARWNDFRADVAAFRGAMNDRYWASMLTDHGFNATPAWTVLGHALIGDKPAGPDAWRALMRVDLLLLAATAAALLWAFGVGPACAALIFFATHQLSEMRWMSGSFLRFDWLAGAMLGIALWRRGWALAAGFALTWAMLVRVFPGALIAGIVLHTAFDLVRRRSLVPTVAQRRFALGCALALATLLPLSVVVAGRAAWPGFVANSRKHLSTPLLNFVGWKSVVSFDPGGTADRLADRAMPDPYTPWHEAVRERDARRAPAFWAGVAAFTLLLVIALPRAPGWSAPILGIGLVVVATQIGAYYWAILMGYGLLTGWLPAAGIGLLLASAASIGIADRVNSLGETLYVALSALWITYVVGVTALAARRGAASDLTPP